MVNAMKLKKSLLALSIAAATLSFNATAANTSIVKANLESDLENRLRPDLNAVLGEGRYNLNLDIAVEYVEKNNGVNASDFSQAAAAAKQVCDTLMSTGQTPPQQTQANKPVFRGLPGLPGANNGAAPAAEAVTNPAYQNMVQTMTAMMMLEKCKQQLASMADTPLKATAEKEMTISKIDIALVTDDDVQESIIDLVKMNINSKANMDALRGDTLKITEFDFDGMDPLQAGLFPSLSNLMEESPWLFAGVVGAGILLLAFLLYAMRNKKVDTNKLNIAGTSGPSITDYNAQANTMINQLVDFKLHSPDVWMDICSEDGNRVIFEDAAPAIFALRGAGGVHKLLEHMSPTQTFINSLRDKSLELEDSDLVNSIEQLVTLTKVAPEKKKAEDRETPFKFLSKLSPEQLTYMFNDLDKTSRAMLMTQLPQDVMGQLMSTLSPDERSQLIVETSSIDSIDPQELLALADALAIQARKTPKVSKVAASGMSVSGDLMDSLPEKDQLAVLSQIRNRDPHQYHELREEILFWQDMIRIENKVLASVLMEIEPKDLAKGLASSEQDFIKHVLGTLPKPFAARVMRFLKEEIADIEQSVVMAARALITKALRSAKQSGVITKDSLTPINSDDEALAV